MGAAIFNKSDESNQFSIKLGDESKKELLVGINGYTYNFENALTAAGWEHIAVSIVSTTGRRNDRHGNMFPTCGSERILKIIRITVDSYQQFLLRLIAQFYGKLIGFIALIKNRCPHSPFFKYKSKPR